MNNKETDDAEPSQAHTAESLCRFTIHALLSTSLLVAAPVVAETSFTPRILAGATWTDNVELTPDVSTAETESDYILQLTPGLLIVQDGQRMRSRVDYLMQNLFYAEDSERNNTYHQLDASTTVDAVRDFFFIDAAASYTQQLIDPTAPSDLHNMFVTGNVTDAASARATPRISHQFGRVQFDALYSRAFVDYRDTEDLSTDVEDTDNEEGLVEIGSADQLDTITWGLRYEHQLTRYEVSQDFQNERATAELGFGVTKSLRLLAHGGLESDLVENSTDGGLDSDFWMAGFRWNPDKANELEFLGGERYFGNSYQGSWRRTGRMLQLLVTYVEEPTTEAQELAFRTVDPTATKSTLPDAEDFARLTSEPFLSKDLRGALTLTGRRTTIGVEVYDLRRDYIETQESDHVVGLDFSVSRRMSARNTLRLEISVQESELREGDNLDDGVATLELIRDLTASAQLSFLVGRVEREAAEDDNYDANWASVTLSMDFR